MFALLAVTSWADPADPPPEEPPPEAGEEITVWGEAVKQAHQAVVDSIVDLGYDRVHPKDGRTVFQNERFNRGKVVLYDEGFVRIQRTYYRWHKVDPIPGTRIRPYFLCLIQPSYCLEVGSFTESPRKWRHNEDEVAEATAAPLQALGDRMADRSVALKVAALPDALDALWTRGVPLDGGPPLATFEQRRAALLAYWDSRTETDWGERVRDVVAAFVRGEVQRSGHPYTDDERTTFEAVRQSSDPFPWSPTGDP